MHSLRIKLEHARLYRSRALQSSKIGTGLSSSGILKQIHVYTKSGIENLTGAGTQEDPPMISKNPSFGKDPNLVDKFIPGLKSKSAPTINNRRPITH